MTRIAFLSPIFHSFISSVQELGLYMLVHSSWHDAIENYMYPYWEKYIHPGHISCICLDHNYNALKYIHKASIRVCFYYIFYYLHKLDWYWGDDIHCKVMFSFIQRLREHSGLQLLTRRYDDHTDIVAEFFHSMMDIAEESMWNPTLRAAISEHELLDSLHTLSERLLYEMDFGDVPTSKNVRSLRDAISIWCNKDTIATLSTADAQ